MKGEPNIAGGDKYYRPGKFTTFVAYEWTSTPQNRNMHRNLIFKDSKKVPEVPFTSIDSDHPEDLWNWMDTQRKAGVELLAISHNANLSDGIMFPLEVDSKGRPIDEARAQQRVNNEPLSEVHQLKGTSETNPQLSPNDEFANYEILNYLLGGVERAPKIHGSYIREAYENGLAMQETRGYNPYKFGLVGASDSHDTASGYSQSDYFGGHGLLDPTPEARLSGKKESGLAMDRLSTAGSISGSSDLYTIGSRSYPGGRGPSVIRAWVDAHCSRPLDAAQDDHLVHGGTEHHVGDRNARVCECSTTAAESRHCPLHSFPWSRNRAPTARRDQPVAPPSVVGGIRLWPAARIRVCQWFDCSGSLTGRDSWGVAVL
jgi:hypothetical protein